MSDLDTMLDKEANVSDATQGLMTTDTPYSLESYGQGLQIMCEGRQRGLGSNGYAGHPERHLRGVWPGRSECVLDTSVLKREQAEAVVRLMNEAFQFGFHRCSVELLNEVEVR